MVPCTHYGRSVMALRTTAGFDRLRCRYVGSMRSSILCIRRRARHMRCRVRLALGLRFPCAFGYCGTVRQRPRRPDTLLPLEKAGRRMPQPFGVSRADGSVASSKTFRAGNRGPGPPSPAVRARRGGDGSGRSRSLVAGDGASSVRYRLAWRRVRPAVDQGGGVTTPRQDQIPDKTPAERLTERLTGGAPAEPAPDPETSPA